MEEYVFREPAPLDIDAEIASGGGTVEQTELATNPEDDFSEFAVDEVFSLAQRANYNALPKTNKLEPMASDMLYNHPVRWHPKSMGINAGMCINNVQVNYVGANNIFRKMPSYPHIST